MISESVKFVIQKAFDFQNNSFNRLKFIDRNWSQSLVLMRNKCLVAEVYLRFNLEYSSLLWRDRKALKCVVFQLSLCWTIIRPRASRRSTKFTSIKLKMCCLFCSMMINIKQEATEKWKRWGIRHTVPHVGLQHLTRINNCMRMK